MTSPSILIPPTQRSIMDARANTLCSRCREIDLSPLISREDHLECWPDGHLKESYRNFTLGSLNSVFYKASTCNVCKMLCDILEELMDPDELIKKRHDQRGVYHCDLVWSEHGRASARADLSYFKPSVEAIFRMDIGIWHEDEFGDRRRTLTQNLTNLFQPAPWPVPQSKRAGEPSGQPSKFWNTLRNGRLRSPICEPQTLRTWLSKCECSHSMCWWTGPKTSLRIRLFDIKFRCVRQFQTSSDNTVRYVALSYVWGSQAQPLTLSRENHKILSKKGAINLDEISRTISDAAVVVEMLGERYLWVDALCILQDDQDDLGEQIHLMGQIYTRSLVTIMAAASVDSNSGLPGVRTLARSEQRISEPLNGGVLLRTCTPKYRKKSEDIDWSRRTDYLKSSKWETRGWTFQEKVLSRRCLFFMEEQVYWECQCASWCEETCLETSPEYRFSWEVSNLRFFSDREFPVGKRMAGDDVIWAFSHLIEEYTSRTLTFGQDTYKAFSGLVRILEDLTGAKIFQGIHVSEFNRSLCWYNEESSNLRSENEFPSWSWLAWTGRSRLTSQGPQNHIARITCYRVCSNKFGEQKLVPISHDLRPKSSFDTLSVHDLAINVRSKLRDDFHIVFWAEAALLDVRNNLYHPDPDLNPSKNEYKRIGYMHRGGKDRSGVQEFILIRVEAYDEFEDDEDPRKVQLLMISWQDGIARREGVASFHAHEWTRAKPQRKLIVMG